MEAKEKTKYTTLLKEQIFLVKFDSSKTSPVCQNVTILFELVLQTNPEDRMKVKPEDQNNDHKTKNEKHKHVKNEQYCFELLPPKKHVLRKESE